jgi:hypothetical protein
MGVSEFAGKRDNAPTDPQTMIIAHGESPSNSKTPWPESLSHMASLILFGALFREIFPNSTAFQTFGTHLRCSSRESKKPQNISVLAVF